MRIAKFQIENVDSALKLLETVTENAVHLIAVERIVSLLFCDFVWALKETPTARGDLL